MKKAACWPVISVLLSLMAGPFLLAYAGQGFESLTADLQAAFNARDDSAYAELFAPGLRAGESAFRRNLRDDFGLRTASFFKPRSLEAGGDDPRVFLQAIFENEYSAMFQTWELRLRREGGKWLIVEKKIKNDLGMLYKISIPSGRVETASLVEVRHQDIHFVFNNAVVCYDNIPGLETALLILGPGLMSFSPSAPEEKHQLELAYKTRTLNRKLDYAYLRFSNSFFQENVRIVPSAGGGAPAAGEALRSRAATLFGKHYPRTFTVVNSLSRERFSFLPQGGEAVFDVQTEDKEEFTYIFSPFAQEEIHFIDQKGERLLNLYSPPVEEGQRRMFISFQEKFDIQHYELEVSLSPKVSQLSARARIVVSPRVDSLDSLKLRLNKDLEIVRIQDHLGRELFFTQDKYRDLLYVYFLEPYGQGAPFVLEVFYRGRLVPPEQTTDVLAAGQVNQSFVLIPPKYESHLYSHSASWYPGPTDEDFFTARQKIIVPPEFACQANGLFLERSSLEAPPGVEGLDKAGYAVYTYETKRPVKYLSFIVGEFDLEAASPGPPPLDYFVSSRVFFLRKMSLAAIDAVLKFYESLFGTFPFEKLSIVHRLWPVGGGHSPASFVVLNELPRTTDSRLPLNPASPVDLSRWKEYFLCHEIAHQWWGQGVTWYSYHDQWLSEGLAQFSAALYLGHKHGDKIYGSIMEKFCQWTNQTSSWGPITLGSRLSYLNFEAYQAILYNKTAVVLNLLREVVGPEAFFAGLRDFFAAHRYGTARTADFRRAMENASGRDLGLFFKGWFDSYLLPEATVSLDQVHEGQSHSLRVKVVQRSEVFVFPLWLEWQEGESKSSHRLIVDGKETLVNIPLSRPAKKLRVFPLKIVPGSFQVED